MKLAELLHFCLTAKSSGRIAFTANGSTGKIYVREGEVMAAEIGETRGEEAFFAMLLEKDSECHFEESKVDDVTREIQNSTHYLLMEAARRSDETGGQPETSHNRAAGYCLVFKTLNNTVFSLQEKTVIIGRDTKCDITVPDVSVSSKHCRILWNGQDHLIDDLESFNGTYLNETPLEKATPLKDGDHIQVGLCHFQFEAMNEKHSPTDPKEAIPFTFGSETQKIQLPSKNTQTGTIPPPQEFKSIQPTDDEKKQKSIWPFKS